MQEVTGMKWEDYLKQEVLDPLGMKDTWFWPTDKQIANKIELYEYQENAPAVWVEEMEWEQRPYNDDHVFASAGAGLFLIHLRHMICLNTQNLLFKSAFLNIC